MDSNQKYFLKTERLGFGIWRENDIGLATSLWGDKEVTKYIANSISQQDIKDRLRKEIDTFQKYGMQYFPVFSLETNDHIGCCGLWPYKIEEELYELGYHLKPAYWGRGYATEAAKTMIVYAFDVLKINKLFARHHPDNNASKNVLLKSGFQYKQDDFFAPTGLYHLSYQLDKNNWIKGK
ncbi:MAG TPA: GNAT family N-acetyltransferase [Flavipsychrobacter sp.]|nr:GNAT family N-acetyltransferase [Flavipsychrobacter sp.]